MKWTLSIFAVSIAASCGRVGFDSAEFAADACVSCDGGGAEEGWSDAGDALVPTSGVTSVGGGQDHSCAVRNQQLWCWGDNEGGQATTLPEIDPDMPGLDESESEYEPAPLPGPYVDSDTDTSEEEEAAIRHA